MMKMKQMVVMVLLVAFALTGAGCQKKTVSVDEIREKERLVYDDIVALAAARDLTFEKVENDDFAEKWSFVASYVTEDGDILLMSDYDGDLFARERQSWESGWTEGANGFYSVLPTVASDAVAAFGEGDAEDYWYRAYSAKNILAYIVIPAPAEEKLTSSYSVAVEAVDEAMKNLRTMQAVFLDDINAIRHGNVEKDLAHGKIAIKFSGYQTPVPWEDVTLFDVYSARTTTLTFDEDFFAEHQGQMVELVVKGSYIDDVLRMTQTFDGAVMTFQYGPHTMIAGTKPDSQHLTATVKVLDDNGEVVYEEEVEWEL